jgi:hypothetical protein
MSSMAGPDPVAHLPQIGSVPVGTEDFVRKVAKNAHCRSAGLELAR